jgi:kynureninase
VKFEASPEFARSLDESDPLASFRDRFHLPTDRSGKPYVYLSGHSLGVMPKSAKTLVDAELEDWARLGVLGHEEARNPWIPYHELLAEGTASLVGAKACEVVVMNSLTVNLHLMMVSFYRPTSKRYKIVIEKDAFPSDRYAVASQLAFHGFDPKGGLIQHSFEREAFDQLLEEEGDSISLILLGGLNYYTGQFFPLKEITEKAHRRSCLVGFDLAHAIGNVPLSVHDSEADFAVWCSYKYLNSGPGAPGGCFVHERHHKNGALPRFSGWWGNDKESRFEMREQFQPIPTAEGWQLSNPSIFALAPLRASTEIFQEAGMKMLREKSLRLTAYLEFLIGEADLGDVKILTPKEPESRGAMLCLYAEKNGRQLFQKLQKRGVICDWREPHVIRVAPVPLYNEFSDVYRFYEAIR